MFRLKHHTIVSYVPNSLRVSYEIREATKAEIEHFNSTGNQLFKTIELKNKKGIVTCEVYYDVFQNRRLAVGFAEEIKRCKVVRL